MRHSFFILLTSDIYVMNTHRAHCCLSTVTVVTRTRRLHYLSCEFESRGQAYVCVSLCLQHPVLPILRKTIAQCLAVKTTVAVAWPNFPQDQRMNRGVAVWVGNFKMSFIHVGVRGDAVDWSTVLQVGRSRVRFPMVSLEFFIHSGRTMALGLSQPLTEMSTRYISWGVKAVGA
jgi:hypothetical protein